MDDGEERAERRQTAKAYIAPQTPPAVRTVEGKRSADISISEVRRTRSVDGRRVSLKESCPPPEGPAPV